MKTPLRLLVAALVAATSLSLSSAETLGEKIKAGGFEWMLGSWGDRDSKGGLVKITFDLRLDGHAVAVKITAPDRNAEGIIAQNAKTDDIGYVVVDNRGGGAIGKVAPEDGAVVMRLNYQSGDGDEGKMAVVHQKVDADTLKLTIRELDSSGSLGDTKQEIELVRLKD